MVNAATHSSKSIKLGWASIPSKTSATLEVDAVSENLATVVIKAPGASKVITVERELLKSLASWIIENI